MTARRATTAGMATIAAIVVAVLLTVGDEDYRIHVRFADVGLLVKGGDVQIAGRRVGTIEGIDLSDDGKADVELRIDDDDATPLHAGTRAAIRAVGQAGVANRFVDLQPGSRRTPVLRDGDVLPDRQTDEIVNIDALLNTFDARTRRNVQDLIAGGSEVFAGSGAERYNAMLEQLSPALAQLRGVTADLASDQAQLRRLIRTAQNSATAIAERRPELVSALDTTARWLSVLAEQREDVAAVLERAPDTLNQGSKTLASARVAVRQLRPVLREVPRLEPTTKRTLRRLDRVLPVAAPVIDDLTDQLPALRRSLRGLQPLDRPLRLLLASTRKATKDASPILGPLRLYAPELVLGVINGLAGVAVGNYNAGGHYARLEFVQPPQTLLGGSLAPLLSKRPLLPGVFEQKVRQTRRCPGGALPPAEDRSNADILGEPLCDPSMSMQEEVNVP